jgi:hypothetical protein
MITKELLKNEIDYVKEEYIVAIHKIIKSFGLIN